MNPSQISQSCTCGIISQLKLAHCVRLWITNTGHWFSWLLRQA